MRVARPNIYRLGDLESRRRIVSSFDWHRSKHVTDGDLIGVSPLCSSTLDSDFSGSFDVTNIDHYVLPCPPVSVSRFKSCFGSDNRQPRLAAFRLSDVLPCCSDCDASGTGIVARIVGSGCSFRPSPATRGRTAWYHLHSNAYLSVSGTYRI